MSWNPFSAVVNSISSIGGTYLEGKNAVAKATSEAKVITIRAEADVKVANATAAHKMAESGQTQDHNLDAIAMKQMENSYLDEIMIALLLIPIAASFLGYEKEVTAGFKSFSAMPDWYQWLVIGVYVVKFGLRGLLTKILSGKLNGIKVK